MAKIEDGNIESFRPQMRNANKHSQRGMGTLEASMRKHGYVSPMTAAADGEIIDGSARLETVANVFDDDVLVVEHDGTRPIVMVRTDIASADTPEARAISIEANRIAQLNLTWDAEVLLADMQSGVDLSGIFNQDELDALLAGLVDPEPEEPSETGGTEVANKTLAERFIIPPFSVLDARQGYWQERKRAWIALGIQSELGRGDADPGGSPRDAATLGKDGKTVRGDGTGKPLADRQTDRSKRLTWGIDPNGQSWKKNGKSGKYGDAQ